LIGARIEKIPASIGGYDHNFVIPKSDKAPAFAARVVDPKSGRCLEMFTTEPGVQLYTSNGLKSHGKGGAAYNKHQAFCLEAQHYPDSINHPSFPTVVLRPGETYKQTTVYKFSTK
jgi:aldose 1-epimerase